MKLFPDRFAHGLGVVAVLLASSLARAQTPVTDGASFNDAINAQASSMSLQPSSGGVISTVANTTTGTSGTVTYSAPFAGVISFNTAIAGNGNSLSGSGGATPLFIVSPNNETATGAVTTPTAYAVSISNLTVTDGLTLGGTGGLGGGAGLGGGLFAGAGAQVTLSSVIFTGNAAIGGVVYGSTNGGGGGMGGSGEPAFLLDGGGGGLFADAPTGFFSSGDGGGANGGVVLQSGGNAGFGGGGASIDGSGGFGGGGGGAAGGVGGFGGGGGAINNTYSGASFGGFGGGGAWGGFGGGGINDMRSQQYGGGGAGFGGAIFVQNGGSVQLTGNSTLSGNTVAGGSAANDPAWTSGYNGAAAGSEIFMMTGSGVTLAPGAGNSITIGAASDDAAGVVSAVADDSVYSLTGTGVSNVNAGTGAVLTVGSVDTRGGLVILHGNNTYAGGTAIVAGTTLEVFQDSNLGAFDAGNSSIGSVSISDGGALLTETDGFASGRTVTFGGSGTLAAVAGTSATYSGPMSGSALTIGSATNNGTVVFENSGNSINTATIVGGTWKVDSQGAFGGVAGGLALSGGGGLITAADGFTTNSNVSITGSGTFAAAAATSATYGGLISGGALTVGSASNTGLVSLTGTNTFTGGTSIEGGTLNIASDASLGATGGGVSVNGSELVADFSGAISASRSMALTNGSTVAATSGHAVTIGSGISGDTITIGDGSASNTGTIIFTGHNTYSGNTRIDGATLQIGSQASIGSGGDVEFFHNGKLVGGVNGLTIDRDTVVDSSGATLAATAGTSMNYTGRITGGGLVIGDATNTGTVTLAGDNIYFGDTTVVAGTLLVTGRLEFSPTTTVQSGATLGGTGSLNAITLESGATLAPGGTLGTLSASSLTWDAGARLTFELGTTTSDLLDLSGALNKGGSGAFVFDFADLGWQAGQTYTLIDFGSTNFTASDFSYSNTGRFSGTFAMNGSTLTFDVISAPEPTTFDLILGAGLLGGLIVLLRRCLSRRPGLGA